MKKQKILIIFSVVLVLILLSYFVYIKQKPVGISIKDTTITTQLITTTTKLIPAVITGSTTTNVNKNQVCELENCHGLDIKCGPNPPQMCTMEYAMGDRCLQYAKCGIQNGKCQQILNSQFSECKSCIQSCININTDDSIEMFECENKCK